MPNKRKKLKKISEIQSESSIMEEQLMQSPIQHAEESKFGKKNLFLYSRFIFSTNNIDLLKAKVKAQIKRGTFKPKLFRKFALTIRATDHKNFLFYVLKKKIIHPHLESLRLRYKRLEGLKLALHLENHSQFQASKLFSHRMKHSKQLKTLHSNVLIQKPWVSIAHKYLRQLESCDLYAQSTKPKTPKLIKEAAKRLNRLDNLKSIIFRIKLDSQATFDVVKHTKSILSERIKNLSRLKFQFQTRTVLKKEIEDNFAEIQTLLQDQEYPENLQNFSLHYENAQYSIRGQKGMAKYVPSILNIFRSNKKYHNISKEKVEDINEFISYIGLKANFPAREGICKQLIGFDGFKKIMPSFSYVEQLAKEKCTNIQKIHLKLQDSYHQSKILGKVQRHIPNLQQFSVIFVDSVEEDIGTTLKDFLKELKLQFVKLQFYNCTGFTMGLLNDIVKGVNQARDLNDVVFDFGANMTGQAKIKTIAKLDQPKLERLIIKNFVLNFPSGLMPHLISMFKKHPKLNQIDLNFSGYQSPSDLDLFKMYIAGKQFCTQSCATN